MKTKDDINNEVLSIIRKHDRSSVIVTMGGGKTKIGLDYMNTLYHNMIEFLVVAPKISIFQSWLDDAKKFNLEHLIPHIKFSTYLSLHKQDIDYNLAILDEGHSLIPDSSHTEWLDMFSGKILYLTGTKPKKGSDRFNLLNKYCPIRYEYTTDQAVEDNILNDYRIIVHELELSKAMTMKKTSKSGGSWMTSEYKDYQYWNSKINSARSDKEKMLSRIMRMKALMSFPTKDTYAKKLFNSIEEKVILFCNTQAQADALCSYSYHSKNTSSEENLSNFKSGKIRKLSAVLQLSEGVNITGLKEAIIMHSYAAGSKLKQRFGRILRLNPDETAVLHILCFKGTADETWVIDALKDLDRNKISTIKN